MKKLIMCDFVEYNSPFVRLANYHYCNCFIKDGYETLWVSNAFNRLIYFKDKEDYRFKKSISTARRHELADNIYGYAPYSIRLYGNYPLCRNANILTRFEKYIRPNIHESLRKIDFLDADVLWISNPKAYWLTNVVKYKKLVYRIADDYREFPDYPNVDIIDKLLIKKADTVIVSSGTLRERVKERGKEPLYLSNGVEYEQFSSKELQLPKEYNRPERKRVVYVGAIKHWFDTELVKKIAEQLNADIFLIGKHEIDLSVIEKFDNVFILGPRDYENVPAYMQYADVAIIPFIKSTMTDSVSPIKLYEYCSAGVPVVSTNMRETAKLNAPIWVAENHESFLNGVKKYLENGYDRKVIQEYGELNSWSSRYEQIKNALA